MCNVGEVSANSWRFNKSFIYPNILSLKKIYGRILIMLFTQKGCRSLKMEFVFSRGKLEPSIIMISTNINILILVKLRTSIHTQREQG